MELVVPILAGTAVGLGGYGILSVFFGEERQVRTRLRELSEYEMGEAHLAEPTLQPFSARAVKPTVSRLADGVRLLAPGSYRSRLKQQLIEAGNPRGMEGDRFLAAKAAGVLGALLFTFVMAMVSSAPIGRVLLLGVVWAILAFFVPDLWLARRVNERKLRMRRELPDMLDMLTISVEAGLGFDAAVSKLVKNSSGPLAQEFAKMLQEFQAGIARRDAFRHLAERTNVPELNSFIMSMVQADVFGVSVSGVLRTQAREMRVKRRQFAEEMAQKAPVKIVFPLVLCILPATMIVILGPAVVSVGRAFGVDM